ncbi:MAG: LemA family protein [Bacilli bacterium]|nr:LemA family protein [Bacilli bacterium]
MIKYIIIAIVILLLVYIFVTINSFVKLKNQVKEAFATMDVYLKKRWDLIPNIVETVKGYAKHEKDTLEDIAKLRNQIYDNLDNSEKIDTNKQVAPQISKLIALAEAYPELKADKNFRDLSNQLSQVEDEIAHSRKYYNATVRVYNNKVQMIPSNIIAHLLGYKAEKMFEAKEEEKENIKVEL